MKAITGILIGILLYYFYAGPVAKSYQYGKVYYHQIVMELDERISEVAGK